MNTDLYKKIFKLYFRHAVWIDNEILDSGHMQSSERQRLLNETFFHRIAQEFHELNISCALKCYQTVENENDYFDSSKPDSSAYELAINSDIILLDWYLVGDSPDETLKLISSISSNLGTRFIIVFSKERETSSQIQSLSDFKRVNGSDAAENCFSNGRGTYLLVEMKDFYLRKKSPKGAKDLVDMLFNFIKKEYAESVQWYVMSFISKMKTCTPLLLSSVPAETDLGMLAEYLLLSKTYKSEQHARIELVNSIVDNLFEDLKMAYYGCEDPGIELYDTPNFSAPLIDCIKKIIARDSESFFCNVCNASKSKKGDVDYIKGFHKWLHSNLDKGKGFDSPSVFSDKLKLYKKHINNLSSEIHPNLYQSILCGLAAHTRFNETISVTPLNPSFSVHRGSVLKKKKRKNDDIFICISQACDCEHSESLLFLHAVPVIEHKSDNHLHVRTPEGLFAIKLKPTSLKNYRRTYLKSYFANETCRIRQDVINRLASRFNSHLTRFGVNLPSLEREFRNEK